MGFRSRTEIALPRLTFDGNEAKTASPLLPGVRAVIGKPGPVSYSLLAASIFLILAAVAFVWRRFGAW